MTAENEDKLNGSKTVKDETVDVKRNGHKQSSS